MKKHYKEPVIDLFELEVEQGIAQSELKIPYDPNNGFYLGDEAGYGEDVTITW